MAKDELKTPFDPEVVIPKVKKHSLALGRFILSRKKLFIGLAVVLLIAVGWLGIRARRAGTVQAKAISVDLKKSYQFSALTNQGKTANDKIKFTLVNAQKTDQVSVQDKTFTAKNNKLFLIVNLELKNDATQSLNIMPGDLIRLSYNGDDSNMFAPDLHNNLVLVAAISTKLDRVGFVIPDDAKNFKLTVGELDGKKDTVSFNFPS